MTADLTRAFDRLAATPLEVPLTSPPLTEADHRSFLGEGSYKDPAAFCRRARAEQPAVLRGIRRLRRQGGFTLIELLIAVAVIGILLAVAVPNFGGSISSANELATEQVSAQENATVGKRERLDAAIATDEATASAGHDDRLFRVAQMRANAPKDSKLCACLGALSRNWSPGSALTNWKLQVHEEGPQKGELVRDQEGNPISDERLCDGVDLKSIVGDDLAS